MKKPLNKLSRDELEAAKLYDHAVTLRAVLDMYSDAAVEAASRWLTEDARDAQDAEVALLFCNEHERRLKARRA